MHQPHVLSPPSPPITLRVNDAPFVNARQRAPPTRQLQHLILEAGSTTTMSRASVSLAHRPLSTTEELEKLEHRAHRIVITSILPVVEQYGEQCRAVWDSSKFWKQFFEAAANVSLSGYEELAANDESTTAAEETTTATHEDEDDETSTDYTPRQQQQQGEDCGDDRTNTRDESLLSDGDGDLTGSTPRPSTSKSKRPRFSDMRSPYEVLREELNLGKGGTAAAAAAAQSAPKGPVDDEDDDSSIMMLVDASRTRATNHDGNSDDDDNSSAADSALLAERTARLPDMSMTPRLSLDERHRRAAEEDLAMEQQQKNPLLHRVMDKTYRIQATPHKTIQTARSGTSPMRLKVTEQQQQQQQAQAHKRAAWQDSSPMSSPEMAVPKLRSAAFLSPVRAAYRSKLTAAAAGPRTPGVSVQTPAMKSRTRDISFDDLGVDVDAAPAAVPYGGASAAAASAAGHKRDEITWESSDDDGDDLYGGFSPPKTISFALPPSKLLQTPAREASKRIVEDILYTAGDDTDNPSEYSPTMVKMNANILDETF
ncbi:dash complex subunit [Grosmannia clavigera kw1407]|uniref:DASH complex subunit ASK1 n=1 Tax=Grosmannia clavigera (strain kw1407 / UAMH 11150) TaxID=655863 RepID=F0X8W2_GROCL|nr:dash complex subunit [Grosmannia clavigera kw1407]EFX05766.1 dash complex subunit [Grosmannia clavigera kw1407]